MLTLNASFTVLSQDATFKLADACATARGTVDKAEGTLAGQFIVMGYNGMTSGMEPADVLREWFVAYAKSKGATEKGKHLKTDTIPAADLDAFLLARNSFQVAKSIICKAYDNADKIIPRIADGGSLFLDSNGMPRSKDEIKRMTAEALKPSEAEAQAASETQGLQRALASLATALRQASALDDTDRETFMRMAREQLELFAIGDDADDSEG